MLPLDVLAKTFSYLDIRSLIAASLVCRPWNALSRENFLWRSLAKQRWKVFTSSTLEPREYYIQRTKREQRARELLYGMCFGSREEETNELELLSMGREIEEHIATLVSQRQNLTIAYYASKLLCSFPLQHAIAAWKELLRRPADAQHVEDGALIIASTFSKRKDQAKVLEELDRIAARATQLFPSDSSELQRMNAVREVLFNELQFRGDVQDYYNPENCMIDVCLLDRRVANPITLCAVFAAVCRRVGVVIQLLGTPGHFMTRFKDSEGVEHYIDCYRGGVDVEREEVAQQLGIPSSHESLSQSLPLLYVWVRMLNNLHGIYSTTFQKADLLICLEQLLLLHPTESLRFSYANSLATRHQFIRMRAFLQAWQPNTPARMHYESLLEMLDKAEAASVVTETRCRTSDVNPPFRIGQMVTYAGRPWAIISWRALQNCVYQYQLAGATIGEQWVSSASLQLITNPTELRFAHLGVFFERFDGERYVPNKGRRKLFPDD